jgi:hypothetical protein
MVFAAQRLKEFFSGAVDGREFFVLTEDKEGGIQSRKRNLTYCFCLVIFSKFGGIGMASRRLAARSGADF